MSEGDIFTKILSGAMNPDILKPLGAGVVLGGLACYFIVKRKGTTAAGEVRSTTASGSMVYESSRAVDEYLQFHFASPSELAPLVGQFVNKEVLLFPALCAKQCASSASNKGRALDIGCAVGGSVFELARDFTEVVGFDFSSAFIAAAQTMKDNGSCSYNRLVEGTIMEEKVAKVPAGIDRSRVKFIVGDACNMPALKLGTFDSVLAANLLCRVPDPAKFLKDVHYLVKPGGVLVLVSPFSWLTEYTAKEKWVGGFRDSQGRAVFSEDRVKAALSGGFDLVSTTPMPFLIREHQRKNQKYKSEDTVTVRRVTTPQDQMCVKRP